MLRLSIECAEVKGVRFISYSVLGGGVRPGMQLTQTALAKFVEWFVSSSSKRDTITGRQGKAEMWNERANQLTKEKDLCVERIDPCVMLRTAVGQDGAERDSLQHFFLSFFESVNLFLCLRRRLSTAIGVHVMPQIQIYVPTQRRWQRLALLAFSPE